MGWHVVFFYAFCFWRVYGVLSCVMMHHTTGICYLTGDTYTSVVLI
jgi:hypothetical protein